MCVRSALTPNTRARVCVLQVVDEVEDGEVAEEGVVHTRKVPKKRGAWAYGPLVDRA